MDKVAFNPNIGQDTAVPLYAEDEYEWTAEDFASLHELHKQMEASGADPERSEKKMVALNESCINCMFYRKPEQRDMGECRYNPPQVFIRFDGKVMTYFPRVQNHDYCGKYAPVNDGFAME